MEAKGQIIDDTPIYYKDKEARDLLGDETLETEAQTCTGGINELKQSLDAMGVKMSAIQTGTTNANGGINTGWSVADHPIVNVIVRTENANVYGLVVQTSSGNQWILFKNSDGSVYASQSISYHVLYL